MSVGLGSLLRPAKEIIFYLFYTCNMQKDGGERMTKTVRLFIIVGFFAGSLLLVQSAFAKVSANNTKPGWGPGDMIHIGPPGSSVHIGPPGLSDRLDDVFKNQEDRLRAIFNREQNFLSDLFNH